MEKDALLDVFSLFKLSQLVKSTGSIGANYYEAIEAESKKDFIHKIGIARKEAKETQLWIRLLVKANPELKDSLVVQWREAEELIKIFSQSIKTARISIKH